MREKTYTEVQKDRERQEDSRVKDSWREVLRETDEGENKRKGGGACKRQWWHCLSIY